MIGGGKTRASPGLSPREQRFVEEYLTDLNGTRAAMCAGYTQNARAAKVQASRLLRRPHIRHALATRTEAIFTKLGFTQELVVKAIHRNVMAAACADPRVLFDDDGNVVPISQLTEAQAGQIAGLEVIIKNARAGDGMTDEVLKVKLKDMYKWVELACQYFGMIQDKPADAGNDD